METTFNNVVNGVISTNCQCEEYQDSDSYCEGDCWEWSVEDFAIMFNGWLKINDTEEFAIYGTKMGWRNSSGHTGRLTTFEELMESLKINGDFTLLWEFNGDGKTMKISRSSHYEYGTSFELRVWNEGDDE